jgi:DNA adenine methylase
MSAAPELRARAPFAWFGAKQRLAARIADLLPPHRVYVEVFGGGASVLFTKPRSALEVYNDADEGLVNFFRVLRDEPDELARRLRWTLYSRAEWEDAKARLELGDPVERARCWFAAIGQAYAGDPTFSGWGGDRYGTPHLAKARAFANRVDHLHEFAERFRGVQVERLDWRDCLDRYDAPAACFYVDPPYVPETRSSGGYRHELTMDDHAELVARLAELEGAAIVSGYDHELYDGLELAGYDRRTYAATTGAPSGAATDRTRTEVLWIRVPDGGRLF